MLSSPGAQTAKKSEPVHQGHAEIEDDGVRMAFRGHAEAGFGRDSRPHLIPLQGKHPGERLRHPLVVVNDEDFGRNRVRRGSWHVTIVAEGPVIGHEP